jgi:hypothetical protein
LAGLVLGLTMFVGSEAVALAQSDPSQLKAAQAAFVEHEAKTALACSAAVAARAAHRHFLTLAEAQRCAPGATVSETGRFALQISPVSNLTGYSETLIVREGVNQYSISRLTNLDGGLTASRAVLASGCPEMSTWNNGHWFADTYINNQTRWARYWSYCGGAYPYSHVAYVSPQCQAFAPFHCTGTTTGVYDNNSTDAYTYVTNNYVACTPFCLGSTLETAWQEMTWDSRGWYDYSSWFN